jgi:hypothetical protein
MLLKNMGNANNFQEIKEHTFPPKKLPLLQVFPIVKFPLLYEAYNLCSPQKHSE